MVCRPIRLENSVKPDRSIGWFMASLFSLATCDLSACSDVGDSSAVPCGSGLDAAGISSDTAAGVDAVKAEATGEAAAEAAGDTNVNGSDATLGVPTVDGTTVAASTGNDMVTADEASVGATGGPGADADNGADVDNQAAIDAGAEAESQTGAEMESEAGVDATLDAGADVASDAKKEAAVDSGADVEVDAGGDGACAQQAACNSFVQSNAATFLPTNGASHVCNATELTLYAKAVSGQAAGSCLKCAYVTGCLDDTYAATDINKECEDAVTTTDAGAAGVSLCLDALGCDLAVSGIGSVGSCPGTSTGTAPVWNTSTGQAQVNNAYCGIGVTTTVCTGTGAGQGPMGACVSQISAGFPSSFTPTQLTNNITNPVYPAGLGDQLASCLIANCDGANPACFP
jgi:hypothetical protein